MFLTDPSSVVVLAVAIGAVICLFVGDYYYRKIEAKAVSAEPLDLDEEKIQQIEDQHELRALEAKSRLDNRAA